MKGNKLLVVICVAIVLVIVTLVIYRSHQNTSSDEVFRIGVILPLTGPVAADGEDALIGIKIAKETPICKSNNVVFIVKDSKLDAKETSNVFNLLTADNVDAMIVAGDLSCQVIQPMIERNSIPVVAPMAGSPQSIDKSDWIFRCWTSVEHISKVLATYASRDLNFKKIAILHIDALHGVDSAKAFTECFNNLGGQICVQEVFPLVTSDIKTQISKILKSNPEAVYVTGYGLGYVVALNQLREVGYKGIILADAAIDDPRVQKNIVDKKDIIYAGSALEDNINESPATQDFFNKYREIVEDSEANVPPQAPFTFEGAMVLINAFSSEGKSRVGIRDFIGNLKDFPSIFGDISFDKAGEIYFPIHVKKYDENGAPLTLNNHLWKEVIYGEYK